MDDNKVKTELISTLFAAFPREYGASDADIVKRKSVYVAMLSDLPAEAVRLACRKAYLECDRLPSIASLVKSVRSLMGTVNEDTRGKTWDEAWKEINRQMYACPYGKNPNWSAPEIAEAVNTYGWTRLQTVESGTDFAVAESQIRRYYEQICKRGTEQEINSYILSKAGVVETLPKLAGCRQERLKSAGGTNIPGDKLKRLGGHSDG